MVSIIIHINTALQEIDSLVAASKYFSIDKEPICSTKRIFTLLLKELKSTPNHINIRTLRAMHDIGVSSYREFENTAFEDGISNGTEELYRRIPIYKSLEPLRNDFGKEDPV